MAHDVFQIFTLAVCDCLGHRNIGNLASQGINSTSRGILCARPNTCCFGFLSIYGGKCYFKLPAEIRHFNVSFRLQQEYLPCRTWHKTFSGSLGPTPQFQHTSSSQSRISFCLLQPPTVSFGQRRQRITALFFFVCFILFHVLIHDILQFSHTILLYIFTGCKHKGYPVHSFKEA